MITALDDRDSRLQGIAAGADDFVTKPVDGVELQTRVQTITRLNRYRRLLMERNKFEWVVQQAEDGYLILSDCTDIIYANRQARLYLGLTGDQEEAINETFLALIEKQYHLEPQKAWAAWPEHLVQKVPLYLVRPESATASTFWLQVDLMEMASRSSERYAVCLRDITPSVVAQRVMWTFHDQVSHKLNTPLTLLLGYLDILHEDQAMLPETSRNPLLSSAYKKARELRDEVSSVFQFMRGTSLGISQLSQAACSIADIPKIIRVIETGLDLEPVLISCPELENPGSTYLPVSRQALEQVLWELAQNAQKFHPENSPSLEIKICAVAECVSIQVCDDGLTLPPEQLDKMWIPYYQAEKRFTGQVPGLGLGLAMVASIIWGVGGTCHTSNRSDGPGIVVELMIPSKSS
jgi:two-component system cell cycle response regulator